MSNINAQLQDRAKHLDNHPHSFQGGDSKIVAVYVQSPLTWGIHTGAGQSDIQSVEDLHDKVIFSIIFIEII